MCYHYYGGECNLSNYETNIGAELHENSTYFHTNNGMNPPQNVKMIGVPTNYFSRIDKDLFTENWDSDHKTANFFSNLSAKTQTAPGQLAVSSDNNSLTVAMFNQRVNDIIEISCDVSWTGFDSSVSQNPNKRFGFEIELQDDNGNNHFYGVWKKPTTKNGSVEHLSNSFKVDNVNYTKIISCMLYHQINSNADVTYTNLDVHFVSSCFNYANFLTGFKVVQGINYINPYNVVVNGLKNTYTMPDGFFTDNTVFKYDYNRIYEGKPLIVLSSKNSIQFMYNSYPPLLFNFSNENYINKQAVNPFFVKFPIFTFSKNESYIISYGFTHYKNSCHWTSDYLDMSMRLINPSNPSNGSYPETNFKLDDIRGKLSVNSSANNSSANHYDVVVMVSNESDKDLVLGFPILTAGWNYNTDNFNLYGNAE